MSSRNDDLTADEIDVLRQIGEAAATPARGGLALPRVGDGMTGEQVATLIDAMPEEVHDPAVTDALRFVLHVTRGDSCPAAYEKFLKP